MVEVADKAAPLLDLSNLPGSVPSVLVVLGMSRLVLLVPLGAPGSSL